jgi:hypothetical protein
LYSDINDWVSGCWNDPVTHIAANLMRNTGPSYKSMVMFTDTRVNSGPVPHKIPEIEVKEIWYLRGLSRYFFIPRQIEIALAWLGEWGQSPTDNLEHSFIPFCFWHVFWARIYLSLQAKMGSCTQAWCRCNRCVTCVQVYKIHYYALLAQVHGPTSACQACLHLCRIHLRTLWQMYCCTIQRDMPW